MADRIQVENKVRRPLFLSQRVAPRRGGPLALRCRWLPVSEFILFSPTRPRSTASEPRCLSCDGADQFGHNRSGRLDRAGRRSGNRTAAIVAPIEGPDGSRPKRPVSAPAGGPSKEADLGDEPPRQPATRHRAAPGSPPHQSPATTAAPNSSHLNWPSSAGMWSRTRLGRGG